MHGAAGAARPEHEGRQERRGVANAAQRSQASRRGRQIVVPRLIDTHPYLLDFMAVIDATATGKEETGLMEAARLEPVSVLTAATSEAAHHLVRQNLGDVAPGQRADLVLFQMHAARETGHLHALAMTVLNDDIVDDPKSFNTTLPSC